jgi:polyribonucleotide 5'-hydroxyl-kinase
MPYAFSGIKSKINTWHGCTLEVSAPTAGSYDAYMSEPSAEETPMVSYLNLHMKLEGLRAAAQSARQMGPRVLVAGPPNAGKTSLVRMLTGYATRMNRQPLVVNTGVREGMLALPGTLSAAVFATIIDLTTEWGGTPSSGPSAVPVKLPLAYYYGHAQPDDNLRLYKQLCSTLSVAATSRLAEDPEVKTAGMLIDTVGIGGSSGAAKGGSNYDLLAHIVAEFSVNIIVVLGSERMNSELQKRFSNQRTTLGEPVTVVGLDKSGGVVERDAVFMQHVREAAIREYFFGDGRSTLSPSTQTVDFTGVTVWRINDGMFYFLVLRLSFINRADEFSDVSICLLTASFTTASSLTSLAEDDIYDPSSTSTSTLLERTEPSLMLQNCVLAVASASPHDGADAISEANIMGFVYIADVDEKRRKLRVLAPMGARLGDRPLLWGSWPEPMVSLVG